MRKLLRITTRYNEIEDRIRIDADSNEEKAITLWFTQRLLIRLAKNCLEFLSSKPPELKKLSSGDRKAQEEFQSLLQQSAERKTQGEDAVKVCDDSPILFVKAIDVKHSGEEVVLVFRETTENQAMIAMSLEQLGQWLSILSQIWQQAEWPMEIWPNWIGRNKQQAAPKNTSVH